MPLKLSARLRMAAIFMAVFFSVPSFSAVKVRETSTLSFSQEIVNSQLRNLLRNDIQFGSLGVYDGSAWVRGSVSIHVNDVKVQFLADNIQISLDAVATTPLGKKRLKIAKTLSAANWMTSVDASGFCNFFADIGADISAGEDLLTDMSPGSVSSPVGLFRTWLKDFKIIQNFAQYSTSTPIEKCYPAKWTGVVDFGLTVLQNQLQITVNPELEYLSLNTFVSGQLSSSGSPRTLTLTFKTNFPMAFRVRANDMSFANVKGQRITVKLSEIKSGISTTSNGKEWVTTASGSYEGPLSQVFPDVVIDLESPCGELVQHYKALMLSPTLSLTLNRAEIP